MLNPEDPVDIFALHYVYLPIINDSLKKFQNGHNNHKVRTLNNQTPLQVYLSGILQRINSNHSHIHDMLENGTQENEHLNSDEDAEAGPSDRNNTNGHEETIPALELPDYNALMGHLQEVTSQHDANLENLGLDYYVRVRECIRNYMARLPQ